MKLISLLTLSLLLSNSYIITMESSAKKDAIELTQSEKDCYKWFTEQQKNLPPAFQKLSAEDQQTFEKQIKYQDNPDAVTQSRHHFADLFYQLVQEAKLELPYNLEMLKSTLVKMTQMMHSGNMDKPKDLLSARMYVFSKLLTPEEKITYSQENYQKDPAATKEVIRKWSGLVCDQLIELKQLDTTTKAQKEQELYDEVVARFEHVYKSK